MELGREKKYLYEQCVLHVRSRIEQAQHAIRLAQASANEESKSSMGDKYETGRAMAQLEIEKNTKQLAEAMKLNQVLDRIQPEKVNFQVANGSLVKTTMGNYFLAVSVGKIVFEGVEYFAISGLSPIGSKLLGKRQGEKIDFNGNEIRIEVAC